MTTIKSEIVSIGEKAISPKDKMIILFGEKVTPLLAEVSVIQKLLSPAEFNLKKGDQIKIGQKTYEITQVGELANSHLNQIGHVTLMFQKNVQDEEMKNNIYLSPDDFPEIKQGERIEYIMTGEKR